MKKTIYLLLTLIIFSCNVNRNPNIKDTLNFIKQEIHQNVVSDKMDGNNVLVVKNVQFEILNYKTGECKYSFDFNDDNKFIRQIQTFKLKDAISAKMNLMVHGISIEFEKESVKTKVYNLDNYDNKKTIWNSRVTIVVDVKVNNKITKAFNNAIKICRKNIDKDLFSND